MVARKGAKYSATIIRLTFALKKFMWLTNICRVLLCIYLRQISTMLDAFEILTTSGVVLWSRSYTAISPSVINSLITHVFIEERTLPGAGITDDISAAKNPPFKHDQHTLKWTTVKELGLIFVVRSRYDRMYIGGPLLTISEIRLYIGRFFIYPGLTSL